MARSTGVKAAPELLTALLARWASDRPEKAVYTWLDFDGSGGTRTTYAELWGRALRIAETLGELRLRRSPVVLLYPAGPDFAPAFFGTLLAGAIATPVPVPRFGGQYQRLEGVAADCTPGAVLSTGSTLEALGQKLSPESKLRACPWIATDGHKEPWSSDGEFGSARAEDVALLQYTSGSTSEPRGVAVTHASLVHNLATITREFQASADARLLSWLPHFHDMGLIGGFLSPLTWGGESVLMSPLQFLRRPLRWLESISQHGIEVSGAPNFAFESCLHWAERTPLDAGVDLRSWRIAFVGAEPVRASTLERFAGRFAGHGFRKSALLPCYGLAEATLLVTCKRAGDEPAMHSVSREGLERGRACVADDPRVALTLVGCGHAVQETVLRIVDPDSGEPLGCNEVGELWIAGPQVSSGYWLRGHDPQFCATLADSPGTKFLRSGDLGYLTSSGEFVFVDRLKDLIVLNGQNYACHDLEQTAAGSHPLLRADACAVMLTEGTSGPQLTAVVELPAEAAGDAEEAGQAIRGALFSVHGLALRTVVFVPTGKLSRTTSGKLQRKATLERLLSGSLRVIASSGEPLHQTLR